MADTEDTLAARPLLSDVCQTLLAFEQMPGRYPVARREPAQLFDHLGVVLQLATGRPVEGLAPESDEAEAGARRAARYFVRTVMLRPGADHYTLLGLTPGAAPETLRDHYRMMIRLTHPDFAASGEVWPADAATRINIANDVLSSPVQRSLYSATLAQDPATAAARGFAASAPGAPPWARGGDSDDTASSAGMGKVAAVAGLLALAAGGWWLFSGVDPQDGLLAAKRPQAEEPDTASPAAPSPAASAPTTTLAQAPREPAAERPAAPQPAQAPSLKERLVALLPTKSAEKTDTAVLSTAAMASPGGMRLLMDTRLATPEAGAASPKAEAAGAPDKSDKAAQADRADKTETAALTGGQAPDPATQPPIAMADVQPAMAQVLNALQTGRGEAVVQTLDREWRGHPAAARFASRYNQLLAGRSVAGLGQVKLRSGREAGMFVVDGAIDLLLQDNGVPTQTHTLRLRAFFLPQEGAPVLTQLVAQP